MAWLVSLLGAALALAGAASLGNGVSYIRLDWGQTETVAGTVALSAGIVTLGLGAVLFALRDVVGRMATRPTGVGMEALTWSEDDAPEPQPMLSRVRSRLATVGTSRVADIEPSPMPADPDPEPAPVDSRPLPAPTARAATPAVPQPPLAVPEEAPPPPVLAEAPTVVGRYESNGASYVLFSDGTIEVETENGTHRFASMADLKAHIERQDVG
ncbi:hypothetical protein [Lichenibacterium ramalinae]|uniref:DUF308 domain-containing protein n=1 Tax=Lichenibacterium ramalinae TaxID=2316527 RepID=A0A4V1RIY7_9HYPH|nr:hypothetical protein [Lichenibacterium ramalinae]RYB06271.1 hypothetical protein D3272_05780 [Lichenibacterium ramalinae]